MFTKYQIMPTLVTQNRYRTRRSLPHIIISIIPTLFPAISGGVTFVMERHNHDGNIIDRASGNRFSTEVLRCLLQVLVLVQSLAHMRDSHLRGHDVPQPISGQNGELSLGGDELGMYVWAGDHQAATGSCVEGKLVHYLSLQQQPQQQQ